MEGVQHLFPLLLLPPNALKCVLEVMDFLDMIAFSFVSKVSKSRIMDLHLETYIQLTQISVGRHFTFEIYCLAPRKVVLQFLPEQRRRRTRQPVELPNPPIVGIIDEVNDVRAPTRSWRKEGFEVNDWLSHLKDVTGKGINCITFLGGEHHEINSVVRAIKGLGVQSLYANSSNYHCRLVLQKILTNMLRLGYNPYPERHLLQQVLARNYDYIEVTHPEELILEELLVINCKFLYTTEHSRPTNQTINRFFKIWRRTGGNQRLRHIVIQFYGIMDMDEVLNGIDHVVIDPEESRSYTVPAGRLEEEVVEREGGYEFDGPDGTKTTIIVEQGVMEIFFWGHFV